MSWSDVLECAKHPLVTIGGNTKHHINLKRLNSESAVRNEILSGCQRIEEKTGTVVEVFAYPFGSPNEVSQREIDVVSTINIKMAFLADGGYCGQKKVNQYALPRIMLTEEFEEEMLK